MKNKQDISEKTFTPPKNMRANRKKRNNSEHLSSRVEENERSIFWIGSMNQEERSLKV